MYEIMFLYASQWLYTFFTYLLMSGDQNAKVYSYWQSLIYDCTFYHEVKRKTLNHDENELKKVIIMLALCYFPHPVIAWFDIFLSHFEDDMLTIWDERYLYDFILIQLF